MPLETLAGKAISNTYQKVVQTEGNFLADGTGSIINDLSLPGNLYVSGTIYANNTVTITQSYYSGSNIFGDSQSDTQRFTGSMLITGSTTWNISGSPNSYIVPTTDGIVIGNSTSGTHIRVRNSNRTALDQSVGFGSPNFGWSTSDRITILTGGTTSGQTGIWVGSSANSNIFKVQGDSRVGINVATATATLHISGSAGTSSALLIQKSGSTVLDIQGSSGQLFSVTDSLTGSLFSVNTVAGLPVIEAFSDNTVNIGKFGVYPIKVAATGTLAQITGSVTGSLTGSVLGSATSSSFASTASYINPLTQSVNISGSLNVTSTSTFSDTITSDASGFALFKVGGNGVRMGNLTFDGGGLGTTQGGSAGSITLSSANYNIGLNRYVSVNGTLTVTGSLTNSLLVKGSGTTSATTALLVQNANDSASLQVRDDNTVTIGFASTNNSSGVLNVRGLTVIENVVNGSTIGLNVSNGAGWGGHNGIQGRGYQYGVIGSQGWFFTDQTPGIGSGAGLFGRGSIGVIGSGSIPSGDSGSIGVAATTLYVNPSLTYSSYNRSASAHIIGLTTITGSTSILGLTSVYKSGSTVLDIQGSQGQLFSVIDSLTGSLMSVNDVSGLPILEVFSDDKVVMGTYGAAALIITGSVVNVTGSLVVQGQQIDAAAIWFMS